MMYKLLSSTLGILAVGCLFAQPVTLSTVRSALVQQIKVDGKLDATEWKRKNVMQYDFGIGTCYYCLLRDTIYLAFDIAVDTYDDAGADGLEIAFDLNGNRVLDGPDNIFLKNIAPPPGVAPIRLMVLSDASVIKIKGAVVAGFFGYPALLNTYPHRTWEIAVPANQFSTLGQLGFAFTITSRIPQFNKTIGGEPGKVYSTGLQLVNGKLAVQPIENQPVIATAGSSGEKTIISKKILPDGKTETVYSDGSKRLDYPGGYTLISPDGTRSMAQFVQVPRFVPPSLPNNTDMNQFLKNTDQALTEVIAALLNHDAESINNLKSGDAALNIYQLINRRFHFLNILLR